MLPLYLRVIFALITGWIFSGIINYIADVLPQNRKLIRPSCMSCLTPSNFSRYLFYKKCPVCRASLPRRNFFVVLSLVVVFVYLAVSRNQWNALILDILITSYLALLIVIDIEHHLILHITSFLGALLTGVVGFVNHGLPSTILGGFAGLLSMFILFLFGIVFSKILAKRRGELVEEGLGFGDVLLGGILGLLLGWPGISIGLFSGIVLGGVYSLALILVHLIKKKYQPFLAIPYGPFLAGAALLFWIFR